tara:strand:+ start:268 stop:4335 length:4068 start_codon:yes stop_codon:yes gene_type:complete
MSEEVDIGAWLKIYTPEGILLKKAEIEARTEWTRIGNDIEPTWSDPSGDNDDFGRRISSSHDGTRILVAGFTWNDSSGRCSVWDWDGVAWTRVGGFIDGIYNASEPPRFGRSHAISGDGNILAISSYSETGNNSQTDAGVVRVYHLVGSTWTILPDSGPLTGTTAPFVDAFVGTGTDYRLGYGNGPFLSYDGKTLAFCEYQYNPGSLSNAGRVLVYQYSNGAWSYKGTGASQFVGGGADHRLGTGMSMSEDGNCLVIGSTTPGHYVEVYTWDGSAWNLKGARISYPGTPDENDAFGVRISISNDGNVLSVGAYQADIADGAQSNDTGIVYMYHYDSTASPQWVLRQKLTNPVHKGDDDFGAHVSLSGNGKKLLVAAPNWPNGGDQGILYMYEYHNGAWILQVPVEKHSAIGGGNPDYYLGYGYASGGSAALSRDGNVIFGGELGYNSGVGRVRAWVSPGNIKNIWGSNDNKNWTNITTTPSRDTATSNVAGVAFGYDGRIDFKNLDNSNYYKYHAIVTDAFTSIKNVNLFGIRKQGSSTLHDGELSLTKNLTVPRIGPALDTDDTPRRDKLVVELNTTTNPIRDGVFKDTSGRGNDGVPYDSHLSGGPLNYGTALYRPDFKAISFDGSRDYIKCAHLGNIGGEYVHSVSMWLKLIYAPNSNWNYLYHIGPGANASSMGLAYYNNGFSDRYFSVFCWDGDRYNYTFPQGNQDTSLFDEWHHFAVVYEGGGWVTNTPCLYVDGVKIDSTKYTFNSTNDTVLNLPADTTLTIGAQLGATTATGEAGNDATLNDVSSFFKGLMSNFKLYECALTAEEVKTLYDMGRSDEGHHVVNFSKTRVGIGLGDGQVPVKDFDVRGDAIVHGQLHVTSGTNGDCVLRLQADTDNNKEDDNARIEFRSDAGYKTALVGAGQMPFETSNDNGLVLAGGMIKFYTGSQNFDVHDTDGSGSDSGIAEIMRITSSRYVGIGTTAPTAFFHVMRDSSLLGEDADQDTHLKVEGAGQLTVERRNGSTLIAKLYSSMGSSRAKWIYYHSSTSYWQVGQVHGSESGSSSDDFKFFWKNDMKAYIDASDGTVEINFTGQHRTFIDGVPTSKSGDFVGLIVSANKNKYMKMSKGVEMGSNAITINESLPLVSLSTVAHDKACFGVISDAEDSETRKNSFGSLVTISNKEEGDTRVHINSVGEGAIWVTNISGPLESGDYITTSNVAGYGQKQDDDVLHNYTVAKITMDCDFDPVTQPIQIIKRELSEVNYWVNTTYENVSEEEYSNLTDEDRRIIDGIYQKIIKLESKTEEEGYELEVRQELVNVLDEHGEIQWEDDPSGDTEKAYKIRYLDADGNITDQANAVHIAAFVGCTYHCG